VSDGYENRKSRWKSTRDSHPFRCVPKPPPSPARFSSRLSSRFSSRATSRNAHRIPGSAAYSTVEPRARQANCPLKFIVIFKGVVVVRAGPATR